MTNLNLFNNNLCFKLIRLLFIAILCNNQVNGYCPEKCQCVFSSRITCANGFIQAIPSGIDQKVQNLDLSNNKIENVTFQNLILSDLQVLNLSENRISLLTHLESLVKLELLDLSGNRIKDFISIQDLPSLMFLNLSRNPIDDLDKLNNNDLIHLEVNDCDITYLNARSLSKLPKLTNLSLQRNPLKLLDSPINKSLRKLDLSHCNIYEFKQSAFINFPNLKELILKNSTNKIGIRRNKEMDIKHNELQILDISQCDWEQVNVMKLPKLLSANLSNNRINKITSETFSQNRLLHTLLLNNNIISDLHVDSFIHVVQLQTIDLSHNRLKYIDNKTFIHNVYLRELNLSHNEISSIKHLIAINIISLDLSNNRINDFAENQLLHIKHLNLSVNCLSKVPDLIVPINLVTLNLRQNRLSSLDQNSLKGFRNLTILDLTENELSEPLDPEVFSENSMMTTLKLSRNPWNCDCIKIQPLYKYLSNLQSFDFEKIICSTPPKHNGFSWKNTCSYNWMEDTPLKKLTSKALNISIIGFLIISFMTCSILSLKQVLKQRRAERNRQLNEERTAIRERLRRLQRRNQELEEEAIHYLSERRINPLELADPPSYQEAVDMARLTRSADTLNNLRAENMSVAQTAGSVDNLKSRRRARRLKKKTSSDDSLSKRESRREIRLRRDRQQRRMCLPNVDDSELCEDSLVTENRNRYSATADVARSSSEQIDSSSDTNKPRLPSPIARKKKRSRLPMLVIATTDDEASDESTDDNGRATNATNRNLYIVQ